jgi:hypothetical protein
MAMCSVGTDCDDCGPSNRTMPMKGSSCAVWGSGEAPLRTMLQETVPHALKRVKVSVMRLIYTVEAR